MQIRSIGRVEMALGEALRVEMADADIQGEGAGTDQAHVQYYIVTHAGPWALWLSCERDELDGHEAELHDLRPPFEDEG